VKASIFLGVFLSISLSTSAVVSTPPAGHETPGRGELHPRGELAAEQIARSGAEPKAVIQTSPAPISAAEADLIRELRDAKMAGDPVSILRAEEEFASLRGKPLAFVPASQQAADRPAGAIAGGAGSGGERWLPHEFLLAGSEYPELKPTLASDAAGNLYAAIQEESDPGVHSCVIYKSTDGGEHWNRIFFVYGPDLITPSLALAEGGQNWLFMAFHNNTSQTIHVLRLDLDDLLTWDITDIETNVLGVANPRIATDAAEYAGWYVYLVYNSRAIDNWIFAFSRTTDYGATWVAPEIVGGYCGYPGEFYDGTEAHPDIEFGSDNLYIAFDNYSSSCTSTNRDIFLLTSENYGNSWGAAVQLTSDDDDEHDPAVGAVKNYTGTPTTVVAYTRFWNELDNDVWFTYTQDDGATWNYASCIACATVEEKYVNLATSHDQGMIHAAFWDEFNINYAAADHTIPFTWAREDSLSTSDTASDINCRPGLLVDQTKPVSEEAGIAWTDFRNEATMGLDVFYDAGVLPEPPDDYFLYSSFNPGVSHVCAIDGFVDEAGAIEGLPGAEYLIFTGGPLYEGDITAYIYRVETAGDPDTHPDNPLNTGPIAPRTFTFVNSHYLGYYACAHDNAFYVDQTGIYYGPSDNARGDAPGWATFMGGAIFQWDFGWNLMGCVVPTAAPGGNQTLARNPNNGDWWAGRSGRAMYKWDGASWVHQFDAPHLGGSHHDGLEVIGNSLYVSDMTSDLIIQYRLDDLGNAMDPPGSPAKTFFYTASPAVEGMGYGPNQHIWISSGGATLYELGGGALQVALDGIPDQCVLPGDLFATFDLDDYVAGVPPFAWSWEGNTDLTVSSDPGNVVTVTYPPGWTGQETITFTVVDGLGRPASDQAMFTVSPLPIVDDIPDQTAPFVPFDLDDYLLDGIPELITWTASGMTCLDVTIDPVTNVVNVSNPGGCTLPEVVTFTAAVSPCEETMSDEDAAAFDPGLTDVTTGTARIFSLGPPVPNPCTTTTRLSYSIPPGGSGAKVSLAVYDLAGRLVRTLVSAGEPVANALITWDGRTDKGAPASSGIYFFQLQWGEKAQTRQVILLR